MELFRIKGKRTWRINTISKALAYLIFYKSVPCKSGNTTNLFAHLRKQHLENTKKQIRVFKEIKTETNKHQEVKVRNQHLSPGAQAKELSHAVAYFLAKHMQPMYTVEKPGFQKMIAKFHPTVGTSSLRESISHKKSHVYIIS